MQFHQFSDISKLFNFPLHENRLNVFIGLKFEPDTRQLTSAASLKKNRIKACVKTAIKVPLRTADGGKHGSDYDVSCPSAKFARSATSRNSIIGISTFSLKQK